MTTFAEKIEASAGEPVEFVVIGEYGWGLQRDEDHENGTGEVLPWSEGRVVLDYRFNASVSGTHVFVAWSEHWVMYGEEYDGNYQVKRVSRDPVDGMPDRWGL